MNFKKTFKKLLSLLIVAVMLIGVASPVISAVGPIEHLHENNAGNEKLHYVSLGASNTNGYGHHGYLDPEIYEDPLAANKSQMNDYGYDKAPENAYPALIKEALEAKTGREVDLHQLAISSMRVEEVLWLLDDTYVPDEYMNWRFTGGKSWFDMAHKEGGREALRKEYREYISNADVISVDLGWNNFGVYAFNNIMTILKDNRYWKAPAFDRVVDAGMEEEYYLIRDKVVARLSEKIDVSGTALNGKIEMLADVLAYAAFGACYNFDAVIEKIYELNPDAEVVVINIQNLADELILDLEGQEIPLGDLYGELIELVDLYRATLSPHADKYLFTVAGEDGDVDTFLDEFRLWDGDPATLSQDMKDLFDMYDDNLYVRSKIEYIMVGQALSQVFDNLRQTAKTLSEGQISVFTNDDKYIYEFEFNMAWLDGIDLASLDFNNPDTPLEEYGAAVSKHLKNIRNFNNGGSAAYDYVFEDLINALTYQKTQVEIQKSEAEIKKGELIGGRDAIISEKAKLEAKLETETNPDSISELEATIATYNTYIEEYNAGIQAYEKGIQEATVGIDTLLNFINVIIPQAKKGFDFALAGVYSAYVNTLNYAYDTVGTIIQYSLQFNTFYMTPDSMANHNGKTVELLSYVINTFTNNTTAKFLEELGKVGLDDSGAIAPEITVNKELFEDPLIQAVAALEVRYDFGNSFFAHPSVKGNKQICAAVMNALENGSDADAFTDTKLNEYIDVVEDQLNPYYEAKYAELKENGTIDAMLNGLDEFEKSMNSFEQELIDYEIPSDLDIPSERAENIRQLLIEEIALTRTTIKGIRQILATETLSFSTADYAKLVQFERHLGEHAQTLGALALELGYVADPYVAEFFAIVEYHANVVAGMANDAYDYLANGVVEINEGYLEFVELVGSYADKIDPELGAAVRAYLIDTPSDAINIIIEYGEDAVLKFIVDAAVASDKLYTSISAIAVVLGEHGWDIYMEIAADDEYQALVVAIENKVADLMQLYKEIDETPIVAAIDIDLRLAKEKAELEVLYAQLIKVVSKNVKAYDEEVAELLWVAMLDTAEELGILSDAADSYLVWLDGRTDVMLGALLHSFLENSEELGDVSYTVLWRYLNRLNAFLTDANDQIRAQLLLQISILENELSELKKLADEALAPVIAEIEAKIAQLKAILRAGKLAIDEIRDLIDEIRDLIEDINALVDYLNNPSLVLTDVLDSLNRIKDTLKNTLLNNQVVKDKLNELALDLLDRTLAELKEQSPYIDAYLYDYFYNNPKEVIEFFTIYGPYIQEYAEEYGDEVLGLFAYLLYEYGDDAVRYIIENPEDAFENFRYWYNKYGVRILPMVKVYLDVLGVEYYTIDDVNAAIEKLKDMAKELGVNLNNELLNRLNEALLQLKDKLESIEGAISDMTQQEIDALMNLIESIVKEIIDGAIFGEYITDEDSFYVAVTGENSAYAELLAGALGLGDKHAVMNWNNIDYSVLAKADFVTLEYNQSEISGFATNQLLAALALYGNDSLRGQVSEYLNSVLSDDLPEEKVAEYREFVDNAILSVLEDSAFAGKETAALDWAGLLGEENVAYIEAILDEFASELNKYGIDGNVVIPVDMVKIIDRYVPQAGMTLDIFDNNPVFELSIPVSDIVMLTFESYLYANLKVQKEYTEIIVEIAAMNPDVKIALLGQYNPFNNLEIAGVTIPLADIYDRVNAVGSTISFAYALFLPNVTYVDISEVETTWDALEDAEEFLKAYLSNPMGAEFTDSANLYVMHQILNAYGLTCKHVYDGCTDLDCNVCGELRDAAGHNYTAVVTKPDCEHDGYTTYTCSNCGDSYVADTVKALGHKYDNACDADCNTCGATRTPSEHVFGEWVRVLEPTTETLGREECTCQVCGFVLSQDIPKLIDDSLNPGEIVSIVIGTAVAASGIAAAAYFFIKRKKS